MVRQNKKPKSSSRPAGKTARYQALFKSRPAKELKEQICDIGRRLWQREYVDGNGGNISARLEENLYLCSPTGVSKGFLRPDMLCLVDGRGELLLGNLPRSSEFTTHLAIYDNSPADAVVHAHPVHATAFAILGLDLPERLLPEIEVCVGRVPLAPYATPGSPEMYGVIGPFAPQHQAILMANHGLICWGTSVENAYFKMEITDTYCRTIAVAAQLGGRGTVIRDSDMVKFFELKKRMGLPDGREGKKPADLWTIDPWDKLARDMAAIKLPKRDGNGVG